MGIVYPHITIKDTEEASLLQFDATDNTVLIPIPYAKRFYMEPIPGSTEVERKFDEAEDIHIIKPILYTDISKFISDWGNGAGEWETALDEDGNIIWKGGVDGEITSPRYCFEYSLKYKSEASGKVTYEIKYSPEKSYLMASELIKMGLPVLVRPIPLEYTDSLINSEGEIEVNKGELPDVGNGILYDPYEKIVFAKTGEFLQKLQDVFEYEDNPAWPDGWNLLSGLTDKNMYPIKFITSGAYPNIGYVNVDSEGDPIKLSMYESLTKLAADRGDAISLIEFKEDILSKEDLLDMLNQECVPALSNEFEKYKFSAVFTPWCEFNIGKSLPARVRNIKDTEYEKRIKSAKKYNLSTLSTMPACFAYLMAYAYSIQTNDTWWAAAGITRGQIPKMVKPLFEIGESLMHLLQGKESDQVNYDPRFGKMRINPIMNTGSYGYRIWGNRVGAAFRDRAGAYKTLFSEFLNVRMLLCDIKKQIYTAAIRTTFEPNDDITWISFKVLCSNLLDRMKSGRGLLWYKWHKEVSEERATIKARLTVRPIEAVEQFDITVFLTDQDAEVEE